MAKPKAKKPPPDEDEAQSKRFLAMAAELEADGELNLTEAGEKFERAMRKIVPKASRKAP